MKRFRASHREDTAATIPKSFEWFFRFSVGEGEKVINRFHVGQSVRGALKWSDCEAKKNCKSITIDGKRPTVSQLRGHLCDLLAQGIEVVPIGEKCDNWDDKQGCRGHEIPDGAIDRWNKEVGHES